jgi:predicted anti-sigma-YlaC factor YlaD
MKNNFVTIFLILLVATGFYFLGKKNGAGKTKTSIVQNVALVKEIAQLASLQVNGVANIKVTNRDSGDGAWNKFKNYLTENTLQVSLPYEAKYGVDMMNRKVNIDTKAGIATIYLPAVNLLSMQLRVDKLESMNQTGLLNTTTINDFVKAQKQLYGTVSATLENNAAFKKLAETNIANTLGKYYAPLGYKVKCVFGEEPVSKP